MTSTGDEQILDVDSNGVRQFLERARKERLDRDANAWAACVHLLNDEVEYAKELAGKAQGFHDEWQGTLQSIGLRVFFNNGGQP